MYYFAYGSNMNLEHMRRLCGWHFRLLGMATLEGYEFGPDSRGYANIRSKADSKVYGVLYDLDNHCLDVLDEFEGVPEVFNRVEIEVIDSEDEPVTAWVYIERPEFFGGEYVKADYLKKVVAGSIENKLPEEWIKFLKTFEQ